MLVLVLVPERILEASIEQRARRCERTRDVSRWMLCQVPRPSGETKDVAVQQARRRYGRPTLREQRDGVWGIFGAWVREWAGMTRGGERPGMGRGEYVTIPCKSPASDFAFFFFFFLLVVCGGG